MFCNSSSFLVLPGGLLLISDLCFSPCHSWSCIYHWHELSSYWIPSFIKPRSLALQSSICYGYPFWRHHARHYSFWSLISELVLPLLSVSVSYHSQYHWTILWFSGIIPFLCPLPYNLWPYLSVTLCFPI